MPGPVLSTNVHRGMAARSRSGSGDMGWGAGTSGQVIRAERHHQWSQAGSLAGSLPACVTNQTRHYTTQASSGCGRPDLNNQLYFTSLQPSPPGPFCSDVKPYDVMKVDEKPVGIIKYEIMINFCF